MEIRNAKIGDEEVIVSLGIQSFKETLGHYFSDQNDIDKYIARTFNILKIRKSLANDNNIYWLAFVDDKPAGYAKLKKDSPVDIISLEQTLPVSQLQKLYVFSEFEGAGVGKALLKYVLNAVKEHNSGCLWLSVLAANDKDVGFYDGADFVDVGSHDFTIGKETFYFTVMQIEV